MSLLDGLGRQILLDGLGGAQAAPPVGVPAAPPALAAIAGDAQVELRWAPVGDATGYRVYVSPVAGIVPGSGTLLAEVAAPEYLHGGLVNGATYYYAVAAVGVGGESGLSPEASASPAAAALPSGREHAHEDVLRLLFPLPALGGAHRGVAAVAGGALDRAHDAVFGLIREMFGDSAAELLGTWERLLTITPDAGASFTDRRAAVVARLNERAGLSRAYYIAYAARLGWTITIEEPDPNVWRVLGAENDSPVRQFRAGESAAGDRLLSFTRLLLDEIFQDIKPAHTVCEFPVS